MPGITIWICKINIYIHGYLKLCGNSYLTCIRIQLLGRRRKLALEYWVPFCQIHQTHVYQTLRPNGLCPDRSHSGPIPAVDRPDWNCFTFRTLILDFKWKELKGLSLYWNYCLNIIYIFNSLYVYYRGNRYKGTVKSV